MPWLLALLNISPTANTNFWLVVASPHPMVAIKGMRPIPLSYFDGLPFQEPKHPHSEKKKQTEHTWHQSINQLKKLGNHLYLLRHLVTIKGSSYARGFHSHLASQSEPHERIAR